MLKGLVACIILSGMAFPAVAGDRPALIKRLGLTDLRETTAAARRDEPVPRRAGSQPFMLPAATARLQPLPRVTLPVERAPRRDDEASPPPWGPGSTLPEVTARAGGRYAVYDVMRAEPRPRHRGSPFSTALVLRLDGKDDSPAFSVGGGGVAAAVWRAVPK